MQFNQFMEDWCTWIMTIWAPSLALTGFAAFLRDKSRTLSLVTLHAAFAFMSSMMLTFHILNYFDAAINSSLHAAPRWAAFTAVLVGGLGLGHVSTKMTNRLASKLAEMSK